MNGAGRAVAAVFPLGILCGGVYSFCVGVGVIQQSSSSTGAVVDLWGNVVGVQSSPFPSLVAGAAIAALSVLVVWLAGWSAARMDRTTRWAAFGGFSVALLGVIVVGVSISYQRLSAELWGTELLTGWERVVRDAGTASVLHVVFLLVLLLGLRGLRSAGTQA